MDMFGERFGEKGAIHATVALHETSALPALSLQTHEATMGR
jgi:hypothetical protein